MQHHVKREINMTFFQDCEFLFEMKVRVEHHMHVEISSNPEDIFSHPKQLKYFRINQRSTLDDVEEARDKCSLTKLLASKRRWRLLCHPL